MKARDVSPTRIKKKKLGDVTIKSNLRDNMGRSSFKLIGAEKSVSFDVL